MEQSEETCPLAGDNFLEVPTSNEAYEDDEEVKATLKPRFSPLPRRRSSVSSDDAESEAPSNVARKVSFADAFGLDLVSVKEFDTWEVPTTSQNDIFDDEVILGDEFYLLSRFEIPSRGEVLQKVQTQKVLLEAVEFLPGSASLTGIIRVQNLSFEKLVFVRMTLDDWLSYCDILAEYVSNSCDGETDQFSFRISLVSPYLKDGAKIEFCIRYETSAGTFWANNHCDNYQLSCHKKKVIVGADKEPEDVSDKLKKSCLKTSQGKEDEIIALGDEEAWDHSTFSVATIPQIVYPPEDDLEEIDESIDVKAMQHGGHNERELELLLSQHLRIRDASSGDKGDLSVSEHNNFSRDEQRSEELTLEDTNTDLRQKSLNICSFSQDILEDDKPLAYDTHADECYFGQPADVAKITGPTDDIGQNLSSEVQSEGDLLESEQNKAFLVTDSISNRQETSMVDVEMGELDRDSRCEMEERLFIFEDSVFTSNKAFEVRKDALSPECCETEQSVEDLDGKANTSTSMQTDYSSRIAPYSLQEDQANGQDKESTEMGEEICEGEVREHGLHTVVFPRVSSWIESTETFESEKSLTPNATSSSGNATGEQSQSEASQLCAIKEEANPCLLEINVSNLTPEHIHQKDEETADTLSILKDGKQSLSEVNTCSQSDDSLMSTHVADERSRNGFHELMSSTRYDGNVAAEEKPNRGQEICSVTDPDWISEPNELGNILKEPERKYPYLFDCISTNIPVHCDSVFAVHGTHSSNSNAHNTKDQVMEDLTSTETECRNEGVAENMFFAKEMGERNLSASFSEQVESEKEGLAGNISFSREDNKDTFEISVSEHLESQNEDVEEDVFFVKEDNEKDIVTTYLKQSECEKEGVAENISVARAADEETFEFPSSEHEKTQNEKAKEDGSFVWEGDEKDIVISYSEHIESEKEGVAENISFARKDNEEAFEMSASEQLESQNEKAGENISFVKQFDEKDIVISYFKQEECETECVAKNISFQGVDDEEMFQFSASENIETQNEEAKEDISFVREEDEKVIVISYSEHIKSEKEGVAENISFATEDDKETIKITASQHKKSPNEDADEDIYVVREEDERNIVISYSEHKESDKELVQNASFAREDNDETMAISASQHIESEKEETKEEIPFSTEVEENDIGSLPSEPVERKNEGAEDNESFVWEHNKKTVQILASENIESQNEEAEEAFAKEDDKKTTAMSCSELVEGGNENLAETVCIAKKDEEENIKIVAPEHIESQNEEAEHISIHQEEDKKAIVALSSEQRESERECIGENVSSARNGVEDNIEISVFEHKVIKNEEAEEDMSIAKEDETKDIVTASSEHVESETEVTEEYISFAKMDNEEALQISSSECEESENTEPKEHVECQNIVMTTKLGLPQLESLSTCVKSEQPEYVMCSDSLRTQNVDISDIQAMETEYNANEAEITNKETKSQEIFAGSQGSLHTGSIEELYISQETVLFEDYILVDPSIGEEVEACTYALNERPSEGTSENLYADGKDFVKEKCNETVNSERHTGEGTFTQIKETKTGMLLELHNNNVSISCTNKNESQASLKVNVEETFTKDSVSSVEVQQKTTESKIANVSPKDNTTWPVLAKEVVFQQEMYVEESPEQQQHVLEKPVSEDSSFTSRSSDINHHQKTWSVYFSEGCDLPIGHSPELPSLDTWELSNNRDFPQPDTSLGPVILISEAADEREERNSDIEELLAPTPMLQLQGGQHPQLPQVLHSDSVSDTKSEETDQSNESLILKRISYKVLYFLLFMIFAVIIYQYDSLLCSVLYLCSLYWLFFERGTHKESVKKQ